MDLRKPDQIRRYGITIEENDLVVTALAIII